MRKLLQYYKDWKEKRFLRKHGCATRKQYERRYDPDTDYYAHSIKQFYKGYEHIAIFPPEGYADYGFHGVQPFFNSIDEMEEWCENNCVDKWRHDWHRGIRCINDFEFNGIGNEDIVSFVFKNTNDAMMFKLKFE